MDHDGGSYLHIAMPMIIAYERLRPLGADETRENIAHHMAFAHSAVGKCAATYRLEQQRAVYTTPKSYLELISLYKRLLGSTSASLDGKVGRLERGLSKLVATSEGVASIKAQLCADQLEVERKQAETDELLAQVSGSSRFITM